MSTNTCQDLIVWQKAFASTKSIIHFIRKLPYSLETKIIRSQIIRASASVGANIAEGYGRYGTKEYSRFLQVALGSANETEYWLLLIRDVFSVDQEIIDKILAQNQETIKLLVVTLKKVRN